MRTENNNWYYTTDNEMTLYVIDRDELRNYGFDKAGKWVTDITLALEHDCIEKANLDKVRELLKFEAIRRGLYSETEVVKWKSLYDSNVTRDAKPGRVLSLKEHYAGVCNAGNFILKDGKWAEAIKPELTDEEIEARIKAEYPKDTKYHPLNSDGEIYHTTTEYCDGGKIIDNPPYGWYVGDDRGYIYSRGNWAPILEVAKPIKNDDTVLLNEDEIQRRITHCEIYMEWNGDMERVRSMLTHNDVLLEEGSTFVWCKGHGNWGLYTLDDSGYTEIEFDVRPEKQAYNKGDVAIPISSDAQVNTSKDGSFKSKNSEVQNSNEQNREGVGHRGEGIQSRRVRATVESRPIVYKQIIGSTKKKGYVG